MRQPGPDLVPLLWHAPLLVRPVRQRTVAARHG